MQISHVLFFHSLPKPILKKTVSRPASRATDEDIQGSKDALIQDLEKKLRNKVPQQRNSQVSKDFPEFLICLLVKKCCTENLRISAFLSPQQKMSYEERMARRLLGADSAASVFDLENSFSSQPAEVLSFSVIGCLM